MSSLGFVWVDVFTDRPGAGNPLAVVPDGDGLTDAQMQALAAELGISETVYVTEGGAALRIFAPTMELPLAGHPVVGAALVLARLGRIPAVGATTLRTQAGAVGIDVSDGVATMTQAQPQLGETLDPARIASLLGLGPGDVVGLPRVCTTTQTPQAFAQVRDRATLAGLAPDLAAISGLEEALGLSAWCEHGHALAQRFFAPRIGVSEDPATGSAAGALGALRVFQGSGPGRTVVEQGVEMGRPSTLQVDVRGAPGTPSEVRVGGRGAFVLEATVSTEAIESFGRAA